MQGTVYINGIPIDEVREWYIANTGYALQLATPYCEELTVRENLILAAQMKLPSSMTLREKFKRVEQLIQVVCIDLSDSGIYDPARMCRGKGIGLSVYLSVSLSVRRHHENHHISTSRHLSSS